MVTYWILYAVHVIYNLAAVEHIAELVHVSFIHLNSLQEPYPLQNDF